MIKNTTGFEKYITIHLSTIFNEVATNSGTFIPASNEFNFKDSDPK